MNPPTLLAVLSAAIALLFVLEHLFPLRRRTCSVLRRLAMNFTISALAFGTAAVTVRPAVRSLLGWTETRGFGLVYLLPLPLAGRAVLGFLLMDLAFYYWHRVNHRWPFLWRFHNVHHIDPDLDVTTSFRFHFGEVALSVAFRVVQVTLSGVSGWTYGVYELAFQLNTLFHHSNLRLPIAFERPLNRVLVTPRMHGIHHSQVRGETESNFSVVLSWWDRLHGTLRLNVPRDAIAIGVPAYTLPGDDTLWHSLTLPFRRQRDYWRRPDGTAVERDPAQLGQDRHKLED
ncbi:MAG TPA: sterol desaturase family protein [Thermoanaerobaculia bacterium]|jgi:sterol desaturase/sphingolipid hydroxylase (fatty acid hydroxylase superfamily)